MPKLNVQQTNANVIKAFQMALENTNPNLLDNWYFVGGGSQLRDGVFPINQRGQSSYSASGFCVDRWHTDGGFTLSANGVSQTISAAAYQMVQKDTFDRMYGKSYTLSMLLTDGTVKCGTITLPSAYTGVTTPYDAFNDGSHYATLLIYDTGDGQIFRWGGNNVAAVKLEVGTVSTIKNDIPPVFSEEKAKCLYYMWRQTFPVNSIIGIGTALSATSIMVNIDAPVAMRNNAGSNITFTANVGLLGDGGIYTAAAVTGVDIYDNHIRLICTSSGLTPYKNYTFFTLSETTMAVSNEV